MCIRDSIECANHHFHAPIYSKIIIRNLKTLEPVGYEQPGFIQFISPYITSAPAHSCLLYTSDAADERSSVDLGGRRIIKKKKIKDKINKCQKKIKKRETQSTGTRSVKRITKAH